MSPRANCREWAEDFTADRTLKRQPGKAEQPSAVDKFIPGIHTRIHSPDPTWSVPTIQTCARDIVLMLDVEKTPWITCVIHSTSPKQSPSMAGWLQCSRGCSGKDRSSPGSPAPGNGWENREKLLAEQLSCWKSWDWPNTGLRSFCLLPEGIKWFLDVVPSSQPKWRVWIYRGDEGRCSSPPLLFPNLLKVHVLLRQSHCDILHFPI